MPRDGFFVSEMPSSSEFTAEGTGTMQGKTRPSVLEKALQGDAAEFAELYGCLAYGIARRQSLSHHDAEDVAQQTLLGLWKLLPSFRYDPNLGSFRGLVKKICLNRVADQLRKRKPTLMEDSALPEPAAASVLTVEDEREWEKSACLVALDRIRREVKPTTFQSFQLHVLSEKTVEETARLLGLTPDQIYQNKRRVLARLRAHLEDLANEHL